MLGKPSLINVFGASKFWFLARVLPTPKWVVSRFKTLVFSFLWGSKIETVGQQTLSAPVKDGGLGLIDFLAKSKALKISLVVSLLAKFESKAFYSSKYFIGSQLARLQPERCHLRDNSSPSALKPTAFYELSEDYHRFRTSLKSQRYFYIFCQELSCTIVTGKSVCSPPACVSEGTYRI